MEKWQIDKINELYSQMDRLTEENRRLKHQADSELHDQIKQLTQDVAEIKQLLIDDTPKRVTKKR